MEVGSSEVKTYDVFGGYFSSLTWIVAGASYLTTPYVLWDGGILTGLVTLAVITFFAILPCYWLIETLARTEALLRLEEAASTAAKTTNQTIDPIPCLIDTNRRFEISDLTSIHVGKWPGVSAALLAIIALTLSVWQSVIVSAGALASVLPFDTNVLAQCDESEFQRVLHPQGSCWNAYAVCIVVYCAVAGPLSAFELGEMRRLQWVLGFGRFTVIAVLILYSLVGISYGDGVLLSSGSRLSERDPWLHSTFVGWINIVPVLFFNQTLSLGVPALSQPLRNKRRLGWMFVASVVSTGMLSGVLGTVVVLFYRNRVNEMCSLNWAIFTGDDHFIVVRIIAYIIVLFPSIDCLFGNLEGVLVVANVIEGQLNVQLTAIGRAVHRFILSIVPAIGALYVTNVVTVAQYMSLAYIPLNVLLPIVLHCLAKKRLKRTLARLSMTNNDNACCTPYTTVLSHPWVLLVGFIYGCLILLISIAALFT